MVNAMPTVKGRKTYACICFAIKLNLYTSAIASLGHEKNYSSKAKNYPSKATIVGKYYIR